MQRTLVALSAIILAFFAFVFSLLMAIPLAIAAIITGKKLQSQIKRQQQQYQQSNKEEEQSSNRVIEGEYKDISDS